jgi:hypothetical protein
MPDVFGKQPVQRVGLQSRESRQSLRDAIGPGQTQNRLSQS